MEGMNYIEQVKELLAEANEKVVSALELIAANQPVNETPNPIGEGQDTPETTEVPETPEVPETNEANTGSVTAPETANEGSAVAEEGAGSEE